jgi:hypothetical protein
MGRRATQQPRYQSQNPIVVFGDNQAFLALANNPVFPPLRNIDIQYHFTRELVASQQIEVKYTTTDAMIADALIKALARPQHLILTAKMGMYDINDN